MRREVLVVHEHQRLVVGGSTRLRRADDAEIERWHWEALAAYTERSGTTAFRIGHDTITVGHHVGYLQVGTLRMEVLPKLKRARDGNWRALLVHMLREVLGLRLVVHQASPLRSRPGSLLSALVDRYLDLVEGLLREGLVRAYREVEGNESCLRGRLVVDRHVRENAAHKERLYVAYPVFDADVLLNRILHQALAKVRVATADDGQRDRTEALLAAFPEVGTQPVVRADFDRIQLDRRTLRYAEALELARLLLLSERPDLRWGGAPVLSLLFDMNLLFEAYVLRQLRRVPGIKVRAQARKVFWRGASGGTKLLKPDLLVTIDGVPEPLVLDTKWKMPDRGLPSDDDLRQLFAYLRTFGASRGLLLYPRATAEQGAMDGAYTDGALVGGFDFIDLLPGGAPDAEHVRAELRRVVGLAERAA